MRGTHDGEFFGIPASGNEISVQAMNVYYLADGRIVGERGPARSPRGDAADRCRTGAVNLVAPELTAGDMP